jgi:hypothetical protein
MARRELSDKEILAQIPKARLRATRARAKGLRATSARYDINSGRVVLETSTGHLFGFPTAGVPALRSASPDDLKEVELSPSGSGLHWETLDVDLDVPALIASVLGKEDKMREFARSAGSVTSERKAAAARANGAKGGRPSIRRFEKSTVAPTTKSYRDRPGKTKVAAVKECTIQSGKHGTTSHSSKSVTVGKGGKRTGVGIQIRKK